MTDVSRVLAETRTVVLVDWPSREVPDTLARHGLTEIANEGPETYMAYEADGNEVRTRPVDGLPQSAELVYAYRPIDELPDIVQTATAVGATTVWLHAAGDLAPADAARARELVERAGLVFVGEPSIVDAGRAPRSASYSARLDFATRTGREARCDAPAFGNDARRRQSGIRSSFASTQRRASSARSGSQSRGSSARPDRR